MAEGTQPTERSQALWAELPDQEAQRVARQTLLPGFGITEQVALRNTRVLVIGAGGLGCPLLQQIAAAGVGSIVIMDDDTVSWSNLHRQILFGAADVGKPKVLVAADRLRQLQPDIHVEAVTERFTADNALRYLE
ncbi:MAG TPA: ThiF family adenylyltransferase, partial [Candidatus Corynebacterium gallistercoris]|nr:ThiF family adenylyltransferase [Candidatus Corynebacterium gallistercoris]